MHVIRPFVFTRTVQLSVPENSTVSCVVQNPTCESRQLEDDLVETAVHAFIQLQSVGTEPIVIPFVASCPVGLCLTNSTVSQELDSNNSSNENTADNNKQLLLGVIRDLKAIPLEMTPLEHDRVTAAISHVPHVVASLLVNLVNKLDGPNGYMKTIAAGGFKDITRIASSSPELWAGICLSNRDIILKTLSAMEGQLSDFCEILKDGNRDELIRFFKTARAFRNSIADMPKSIIERQYDIAVDVEDKPGIIATIATALARKGINIKNIGIVHSRENEEGALEIRFEDEESMRAGMETLSALGYGVKAR